MSATLRRLGTTLFLLCLAFLMPTIRASAQLPSPSDWQGVLAMQGGNLRLTLHVRSLPDGTSTATLDSVDQDSAGIPVTTVTVTGRKVTLIVNQVKGSFDGTLSRNGREIKGEWTEGQHFPLTFRLVTDPSKLPPPPRPIGGDWGATLKTSTSNLDLVLHVDTRTHARITATLDITGTSPASSTDPVDVDQMTFENDVLRFSAADLQASFLGKLSADGSAIEGTWTETKPVALTWRRIPHRRPQTP